MLLSAKGYIYKKLTLFLPAAIFILLDPLSVSAQQDTLKRSEQIADPKIYSAEAGLAPVITAGSSVPFWMRSNQFGSIPLKGVSGSFFASGQKKYSDPAALVDWGFGMDARLNAGNNSNVQLIEGYVKGRLSIFQLKAGRSRDITGLVDSTLSVGAFSVSGNAFGIPKIELSIPEYWDIPGTKKIIAIKGSISHGWFGDKKALLKDGSSGQVSAYYHEGQIYGRIGMPEWKVKFYGGINHQAVWGSEDQMINGFDLSKQDVFWHVLTGKTYDVTRSKIGNQLGSIDQKLEVDLKNITLSAYHQFFYDIGALAYLANARDGLFGLNIQNRKLADKDTYWKKFLVEFFSTKHQAGQRDSKVTPSGDEDYYNNYAYQDGWTSQGLNIGNPLLTQARDARPELVSRDFIMNNRVVAVNVGGEGVIKSWNVLAKLTYSRNYGTYGTSEIGRSENGNFTASPPPYFTPVNQFSAYVEAGREIKNNYFISVALAADNGKLLYNSAGGFVKLSRRW